MVDAAGVLESRETIDSAPGPRGAMLVGVLPQMRNNPLSFVVEVAREYPQIARLNLATSNLFLLNDPELVQHVLHDNGANYRKSKFYTKLGPFFGQGLITSNGPAWRRERQVSQPAFSGPNLRAMAAHMVEATETTIRRWETIKGPLDIAPEMMQLTLRLALKTLFSTDLSESEVLGLHHALTIVLRTAEKRLWSATSLAEHLPTPENRRFHAAVKAIDQIVYKIIEMRRAKPQDEMDLLDLLLSAKDEGGAPYTDQSLRDQISSILIAGHESGGSALTWTWFLLSRHPDVERRLRREVSDVLQGRSPTFDDLEKLKFTRMVFEESMRIYPPIWTMSREAIDDDEIGGYHVPAGTAVMACPFSMHRDERFWENPEGFDPDRFSQERDNQRPRYAYFPFGGGPRMCIGNRFAMMEAGVIIPMIMQRFHLHLIPWQIIEPMPMISLRPKHGMVMTLHRAS